MRNYELGLWEVRFIIARMGRDGKKKPDAVIASGGTPSVSEHSSLPAPSPREPL